MTDTFTTPPPEGGLPEDTAKTRWPAPSPAASVVSEDKFTTPPPSKATVGIGEDMAKSAGTQGVFGLGDIVGLPGTLGNMLGDAAAWTGHQALRAGDALGLLPGEHTPETLPKAAGQALEKAFAPPPGQPPKDRALRGDVPMIPWPSGEDVEKELRAKIPALDYTPQTKPGEYAGSGARMATNALAGGPGRTAGEKILVGAASGLTSEAAGDAAKGVGLGDYEGAARFLGAILGNSAAARTAEGVRAFVGPNEAAEHRLLQALQEDLRDGKARMTPQQIDEALQAGQNPSVFDMGGPRTRALMSKLGGMTPDELNKFNSAVQARNAATIDANRNFVTREFGLTDRAGDELQAMQLAHKRQNDAVYSFARNDPSAAYVTTPRLEELAQYPGVKDAIARVTKLAEDPQFGIRPPAAAPNLGGPPMAPTPGNLNFWDHVKRDLDKQINMMKRSGDDTHYLDTWRKELVKELDSQVTGYDKARAQARIGFQAEDALEAGTKFATKPNSFQTTEIKNTLAAFTPEEHALFIKGVGDTLLTKAQETPRAFTNFITKPENAERLRAALGDTRYDQLHGYARSTELMHNASTVAGIAPRPSRLAGHTGLLAGMAAAVAELGYVTALPPGAAAKVVAGVAFDSAAKEIKYAAEKRIAPRVMELAQSADPADLVRLGQLLQNNPAANAYFSRVTNALAQLGMTAARSQAGMQEAPRPGRKAGGRIGTLNHAAIAAGLIRAAEKAKKGHSATTEPLLQQPDEAITKALKIANEAI